MKKVRVSPSRQKELGFKIHYRTGVVCRPRSTTSLYRVTGTAVSRIGDNPYEKERQAKETRR